jgi:hypothetical protein
VAVQSAHDRSAIVIPASCSLRDLQAKRVIYGGAPPDARDINLGSVLRVTTTFGRMRNSTGNRISASSRSNVGEHDLQI